MPGNGRPINRSESKGPAQRSLLRHVETKKRTPVYQNQYNYLVLLRIYRDFQQFHPVETSDWA